MLRERKAPEDQLEQQIALSERFEAWALERRSGGPATADCVRAFSDILVEEKLSTWETI